MREASPIRVAIVDDDPSYGRAVGRLLRASGMETRTFSSAEEYLATGREFPSDCVLVDVDLGAVSGFDLARLISTPGARSPVVFISGHAEPHFAREAAEAECPFVRKSEPGDAVLGAIRRAVAEAALPHEAGATDPAVPHLSR